MNQILAWIGFATKPAPGGPRVGSVAQVTPDDRFVPIGCRPGIGTVTLSYQP
jgi:hypothetical protein